MKDDILENCKLKNTKTRKEILNIIEKAKEPLSANEIYLQCEKNININLSTIYRTLDILTKNSVLLKTLRQDGSAYYQLNNHSHKHYLVCTECREVITIDKCNFCLEEEKIKRATGYTITGHNIEITGICPECSKKKK